MLPKLNNTIAQILEILNQNLPPKEMFLQVGQNLQALIPFDRFSLGLAQMRYWFHLQNNQVTTLRDFSPFDETSSASTWVFIHQKPYLRNNISEERTFLYDETLQAEEMHSDLIIPLSIDQIPVGTFNFTKKEPSFYNQTHLITAQSLNHLVALFAKNMLAYQERKAIGKITQELQRANYVDDILKPVLEQLHYHYDRIRIYLYDAPTNSLRGSLQIDASGKLISLKNTYPFNTDPYTQQTLQNNLPQIYTSNTPTHRQWLKNIQEDSILNPLGNQEWAEIALKVQQDGREMIVGKISLDNNNTQIPLIQEHLNQQMIFIRQAAIAISQAQLHQNMAEQVHLRTQQLSATNKLLEEKDKLLTALQEVSHRSFSYLDQDKILDNFAKQIIQSGIFRSLMIALVNHETETIEIVRAFQKAASNKANKHINIINYTKTCGTRYHLNENNITPLTARTGQIQIAQTKTDQRLDAKYEKDQNWDDKIAYFIPVKREDKVVAVLATGTKKQDKEIFDKHLQAMEPLLDQLGIALEHAALYLKVKKNEEHIAQLLDFHAQLLDTPVVWICAFDNNKKMTFWNRAAELISGYTSEEALHSTDIWHKLYPDPSYFQEYIRTAKDVVNDKGAIENIESIIHCKDGSTKLISWHANRLTGGQEKNLGFLAIGLDITHRKKLETEIVRLERLKALGELAAGVSHNLNNMLTGILLPAALLKNHSLPPDATENINDIYVSAIRARDLVSQLNKSVRNNSSEKIEPVDVNQVITEAVRATRARWKDESESKGIHIHLSIHSPPIPPVKASTSGLHDVLLNLIFNAVDALPHGGEIDISTQAIQNNVRILVKDTGVGMASDTKLKIFEPFFTTKMDVGTGLGLSTAYSQIQKWGGDLTVESELGQGSLFCISLSIWNEDMPATLSPPIIEIPPLRILVVEDDLYVRRSIERFLSSNHHITLIETGTQALSAITTQTFDLAFIDLGLPDMLGDQLAKIIKKKIPHLPLVLITGWAISETDPRLFHFESLLKKPISNPEDLINTISLILNKKQKAE